MITYLDSLKRALKSLEDLASDPDTPIHIFDVCAVAREQLEDEAMQHALLTSIQIAKRAMRKQDTISVVEFSKNSHICTANPCPFCSTLY